MPCRSCHHRLISWWATTGGRETKSFGIIHAAASRRWWWRVWALQSASDVDRHRFVCSHMPSSSASGSAAPRLAQVWPAGSDKPPSASAAPQCVHRVISQGGQGGVRQLLAVSISGWLLRSRWHALDAWLHKSVRTGPRSSLACVLYTNPTRCTFPAAESTFHGLVCLQHLPTDGHKTLDLRI